MIPSRFSRPHSTEHSGSALVIALLMIVVLTVLILTVTVQTQLERQLSAVHLADQQARSMTQMGLDAALGRIRATLAPFDDPFGATNPPDHFWSLSPGRIDLFNFSPDAKGRPKRSQAVGLHSGYPVLNIDDVADLNAPDSYGRRPIWSENRKMEVDWLPVARNPAEALSTNNPMVGRFAFWVDDEGSKINVNTADGTDNYSLSSYGQGTPTAVSLSTFSDLGDTNAPDRETVRLIVAEARRQSFAKLSEMATRASLTNLASLTNSTNSTNPVSPQFPATNAFNLTTYNRSPDFNIFNLPKFQLTPSSLTNFPDLASGMTSFRSAFDRRINYFQQGAYYGDTQTGSTRGATVLRSLYPTPSQLPATWTNVWPIMPTYDIPGYVNSGGPPANYSLLASSAKMNAAGGNFPLIQGPRFAAVQQMENYLIGKNPLGQAIRWPFDDSNYLKKYNLRQLDSIMVQTFELARGAGDGLGNNVVTPLSPTLAPYGILGDKPIMSAMGRYPRLVRVAAKLSFFEKAPTLWQTGPGTKDYKDRNGDGNIDFNDLYSNGAELRSRFIFSLYVPRYLYEADNFVGKVDIPDRAKPATIVDEPGHALIDFFSFGQLAGQEPFGWGDGMLNETESMMNTTGSKWEDNLLYAEASEDGVNFEPGNSSGIDFYGTSSTANDTDPRAPEMRRPEYRVVGSGANVVTNNWIWGTGPNTGGNVRWRSRSFVGAHNSHPVPGIFVNYPLPTFPSGADTKRLTRNRSKNADEMEVQKIRLRGGLTLRLQRDKHLLSMSPIDPIRGPLLPDWSIATTPLASAADRNAWRAWATNAVAPIFGKNGLELAWNDTRWMMALVRDPLGGQLPGDWVSKVYSANPPGNQTNLFRVFNSGGWPDDRTAVSGFAGSTTRNLGSYDYQPEAEWVDLAADAGVMNVLVGQAASLDHGEILHPYMEDGVQKMDMQSVSSAATGNAERVLNISKQRNFPSVGHLQYLRTGAMPDNTNAVIGDDDYAGMPFRCLNFGPEKTQGGIPDWAMLDLFVVPNAIWTKPSSRFAYSTMYATQTNRPELIQLTYGGASTGKINLNGSVIWPWGEDDTNYVRPLPLAAQFNGLRYNQDGKVYREDFVIPRNIGGQSPPSSGGGNVGANVQPMGVRTSTNSWKVLDAPAAATLAEAISGYIRQNGPLAMSGQICDIPAVNAYGAQIPTRKVIDGKNKSLLPPTAAGTERLSNEDHFYTTGVHSDGTNQTRNDIVNQSIGNFTTQGNVFSVWVVGQAIQKSFKSASTHPDTYEQDLGDKITAQSRMRFIVERKLDPGVDGIYGNSAPGRSGADGNIGTPDDPSDPANAADRLYHPPKPKFIYQVINVQEIQ